MLAAPTATSGQGETECNHRPLHPASKGYMRFIARGRGATVHSERLHSLTFGMLLAGCVVAACGSASNSGLFGSSSGSGCSSASSGCAAPGTGGAAGNSTMAGGASSSGPSSGGSAGATDEGTPGGASGSSDTGGRDGAGGMVGGGGSHPDAGANAGSAGAQVVRCPEGDYHAVLTGDYRSALGTRDVGATIDFSISASGAATGSFNGPGNAKAMVAGMLDCSSGALTTTIEEGAYQVGFATAHFSGTFDGTYYQATGMFGGMWTMKEAESTTNGGSGPWSTQ